MVPQAIKIKEGVATIDVLHLHHWSIIISQHNIECFNASVPSRPDFQNLFVIDDRVQMGPLTCQTSRTATTTTNFISLFEKCYVLRSLLTIFKYFFFYFPNGRYIDRSSLTYATNKSKTLKLQYRY